MNTVSSLLALHDYAYVLVNVFAPTHFAGTSVVVFPHADGLNSTDMQAIAKQMNASQTVFAFKSEQGAATVRAYTVDSEMSVSGTALLAVAKVLDQLKRLPIEFTLSMANTSFKIKRDKMRYEFVASVGECEVLDILQTSEILKALQWDEMSVSSEPCVVSVAHQKHVLLEASDAALMNAFEPDASALNPVLAAFETMPLLCVWHEKNAYVRMRVFERCKGQWTEALSSASAVQAVGSWCVVQGLNQVNWNVQQGDYLRRANRLSLQTDANTRQTHIGAQIIVVGHGSLSVPQALQEE